MSGGLIQLVTIGAQDMYLTSSPQVTFFRAEYKRYTNFAMESIENTFSGTADFGKRVNTTIQRNGDLLSKVYLQVALPDVVVSDASGFAWCNEVGHFLIKNVDVEIGGSRIDRQYGTWMSIWASLTLPVGQQTGYASMIGDISDLKSTVTNGTLTGKTLYIPLQFWFCREYGLAIPLIALQFHWVKINIEFETLANLTHADHPNYTGTPQLGSASLYCDYIFLDTDERRRFAQSKHEYLIEQLQFTGDESLSGTSNRIKMSFNHPVKELIWVVQDDNRKQNNFTDADDATGVNPTSTAKLQINGHDRFAERAGEYFNNVQPYQHHSNTPLTGVNVYSFAQHPEKYQPSGTVNMSRVDNATLALSLTSAAAAGSNPVIKIYGLNYNVLRIMSGMGGLAYSS